MWKKEKHMELKQIKKPNLKRGIFLNRNILCFGILIDEVFSQPHYYIKHHVATIEG